MNRRFWAVGSPGLIVAALTATAQSARECVQFGTDRLAAGASYAAPLPRGLEVRLTSVLNGWVISVGPADDRLADYLAPVSPPYRSAPHRVIGSAYGVPAEYSVQITPRRFRFVLNERDAQAARDIASASLLGDLQRRKDLDKLPTGSLTLQITGAHALGQAIRWLGFTGEACLPVPEPPKR